MKRERVITSDGSHTVAVPELNVTYHSTHGAVQESRHVFMEAGLDYMLARFSNELSEGIRVFEMGFGTGLNALLSFAKAKETGVPVYYYAVELYPLPVEEAEELNYVSVLQDESLAQPFHCMHQCAWNEDVVIASFFTLHKSAQSVTEVKTAKRFHVIYFDAFAPDAQPELWTEAVLRQMYGMLYEGGVLVTYCSKGAVRRAMQSVGFVIEKLKGPPGKREMVRAVKG